MKLGATGKFPQGKIDPTDEGELQLAVHVTADGMVRVDFGKPVAWLAMSANDALGLAALILKHANEAFEMGG